MARRDYDSMLNDDETIPSSGEQSYEDKIQTYTDIISSLNSENQKLGEQLKATSGLVDELKKQLAQLHDEISKIPKSAHCSLIIDDDDIKRQQIQYKEMWLKENKELARQTQQELKEIRATKDGMFITTRQAIYWMIIFYLSLTGTFFMGHYPSLWIGVIIIVLMICMIVIGFIRVSRHNGW